MRWRRCYVVSVPPRSPILRSEARRSSALRSGGRLSKPTLRPPLLRSSFLISVSLLSTGFSVPCTTSSHQFRRHHQLCMSVVVPLNWNSHLVDCPSSLTNYPDDKNHGDHGAHGTDAEPHQLTACECSEIVLPLSIHVTSPIALVFAWL